MHKDSRFRDEEDSLLPDLRRARKEPFGSCQGSKSSLLENVETENCTKDKFKDSSSPYLGGVSRKEFWLIFGGVLAQYFVAFFDQALIHSIHPVITSTFKSSNSACWLETAFLLTSTAFQPVSARLSDAIGRRPLHLFSLTVFAVAATWCAAGQDIGSFIAARALCGIGAGGVLAMGPIMTNDLVPISIRGTFQSYINLSVGLGAACGTAFGGLLCDFLGWRWTFGMQVPIIVIILALAFHVTPTSLGPHFRKDTNQSLLQLALGFDLAGTFLLTISVACLIIGLNLGGNTLPWNHPLIIFSIPVSAVTGLMLVFTELKAQHPVMPMWILSSIPQANLVLSNFAMYMGNSAVSFNLPILFQAVRLETASMSGLRQAVPNLAVTIFGVSSGYYMTWSGKLKGLILLGALVSLCGSICLSTIWHGTSEWLAILFLIPASVGIGLNTPATSLAVLVTSDLKEQAVMTVSLLLWRRLGTVMGVAISSLVMQNALFIYLQLYVTGSDKEEIIEHIRKSVRAIFDLPLNSQSQVVRAYEQSLHAAFGVSILSFTIAIALIFSVRLPSLRKVPS